MKTLLVLTALVVSAASFAGPSKISCAVMTGNKVDIAAATKAHHFADYKGNRYFFCCGSCPTMFKKDPAKYAKSAAHIKTPKAPKTK